MPISGGPDSEALFLAYVLVEIEVGECGGDRTVHFEYSGALEVDSFVRYYLEVLRVVLVVGIPFQI